MKKLTFMQIFWYITAPCIIALNFVYAIIKEWMERNYPFAIVTSAILLIVCLGILGLWIFGGRFQRCEAVGDDQQGNS